MCGFVGSTLSALDVGTFVVYEAAGAGAGGGKDNSNNFELAKVLMQCIFFCLYFLCLCWYFVFE